MLIDMVSMIRDIDQYIILEEDIEEDIYIIQENEVYNKLLLIGKLYGIVVSLFIFSLTICLCIDERVHKELQEYYCTTLLHNNFTII